VSVTFAGPSETRHQRAVADHGVGEDERPEIADAAAVGAAAFWQRLAETARERDAAHLADGAEADEWDAVGPLAVDDRRRRAGPCTVTCPVRQSATCESSVVPPPGRYQSGEPR